MTHFRARLGLLTSRDLGLSLAAGGASTLLTYALVQLTEGYAFVTVAAAAMAALVASVLFLAHRNCAREEVSDVIAALRDVGLGKLEPELGPLTTIPHGAALRAAICAMVGRIASRMERLQDRAHQDPLTGLYNRSQLEKLAEIALGAASPETPQCLVFIDLDGFKQVNDTLGHNYGDRLLQVVADRLRLAAHIAHDPKAEVLTDQFGFDTHIARFGGDEFVVFLGNAGSGTVAQKIAARIVRVLSEPFQLDAHTARIGASVGCAFAPQHGASFSALLKAADTAMYHAKNAGRNRYEFYHPQLDVEMQKVTEQEQELREALAYGQLELHFQPLYDARSMRICSAEALIRWNHPSRGLLLPGSFMPIVERCRLTEQLGEWVLNEATRRIAQLSSEGTPLLVAVNISPLHIEHVDFAALVRSCLRKWKTSASLLQIEVTEDAAMSNADAAGDQLRQLHDLGVSTAIDDVGTGYSNLASLINLPLSRLKIDRSLLTNLCSSSESRVLVQTIISMANSLGLHSVVEGVETQEQLELVTDMGCDIIQGFLLSEVLTFDELQAVLVRETAPAFANHHLKIAS